MPFPTPPFAPAARGFRSLARHGLGAALAAVGLLVACAGQAAAMSAVAGSHAGALCSPMHRGFDLVQDRRVALGSFQAHASLEALRATGANTVAIVPLLQQSRPDATDVDRSLDMSDGELAHFIRQAHRLGLHAVVDPRIQIPGSTPDEVRMGNDQDWAAWFHHYEQALVGLAAVAADEHAQALVIGTDLDQTLSRPEWAGLIARLRRVYPGRLIYAAQGAAGAERVPFWNRLDAVGVTLQPVLDAAGGPASWDAALADDRNRLLALARQTGRPIFVAELGFVTGPAPALQTDSGARPPLAIDEAVQSRALAAWLAELSDPAIRTVLIWRWNEAGQRGGFVAQGKKIEQAMTRRWRSCSRAPAVW